MILAIDIGNTTIGLYGMEEEQVLFSAKIATDQEKSGAEYEGRIRRILEENGIIPRNLEGVAVSSVVPSLNGLIEDCIRNLTGRGGVWITVKAHTGLSMDVYQPERVGIDRIVDAAWAAAHYPLPVVTVDMGTATTFNVIDEGNIFLGGVIAPGVDTGLRALSSRAAQLPVIDLNAPERVIGKDTAQCMRSGAVIGAAAMIDGLTERIEAELGRAVTLVITGGMASYVEKLCLHPHSYEPDLLAKGLAMLYKWNLI